MQGAQAQLCTSAGSDFTEWAGAVVTVPFVHLHLHSEYSLSNSTIRVLDAVSRARETGMPAIGLTDNANIYAAVKFFKASLNAGVKPIIGADVWIDNEQNPNSPTRLSLLVKNRSGYRNLCSLLTQAYRSEQHNGKACIKKAWFADHGHGLIALSGAQEGEVGIALLHATSDRANQLIEEYATLFDDRFYVELRRVGKPHEEDYIAEATSLAASRGLPVVATNDVNFLDGKDFHIHEIRVCINEGRVLSDNRRPKNFTDQQYFRTPEEMAELFEDIPEALQNTVEIAKRCNYVMDLGSYYLPRFDSSSEATVDEILAEQARDGLQGKFEEHSDLVNSQDEYQQRLQREIEIITSMGFSGYFLIVADFINWAKQNAIPVGPGRGSGAGSLVAWSLGITELDPIKHGLLFERFLNPERVSLPDFDIDFCMDGRDKVIEYVTQKYGRDKVSQIVTHGTMAARAVVRDVGRVLGMPYGFVDQIAKLIPFQVGITLKEALKQEQLLADRYDKEDELKEMLDIARGLEGLARNVGKHAGGVVIAPSTLTDFTGLYCEQGSNQMVTQFDKDDLEAVGLVKFDFLGLRTLTIIDRAVKTINKSTNNGEQAIVFIKELPMDDSLTFDLLKKYQTTALFQLESRGMKELIQRMRPDCFDDLVALVALYRPGPLQSGMVDDFIDRKDGRAPVKYAHPMLEPILKPTYGVILYQEQVMEIARALAGYSLGAADLLRSAMGKKNEEKMATQREVFVNGSVGNGVEESTATHIFDLMEKFAGYGFNKSHSAAYAVITYQTAWLKAHYPAHFMAASISSDMEQTDRVVTLIAECRDMGLEVANPNINSCQYFFEATSDGHVTYGLGAIKGLGQGVIEALVNAREEGGPFSDLFDLCIRVDSRRINKRALESLVQAGALDDLGAHRASLMATLPMALELSDQKSRNARVGQSDLFGVSATEESTTRYVDVAEWSKEQILTAEKVSLGLYLSGHPIDGFRDELDQIVHARLADLNPERDRAIVVAGLVVAMRTTNTRRGRMAFVTLDDQTARVELAVFSELFSRYRDLIRKDNLLVVYGQVSMDEYTGGFKMAAESVYGIEQAREAFADTLTVEINSASTNISIIEKLAGMLARASCGECRVVARYVRDSEEGQFELNNGTRVRLDEELLSSLREILGDDNIHITYRKNPVTPLHDGVESAA
jgi:DNA polymerase-3 subunit alpha